MTRKAIAILSVLLLVAVPLVFLRPWETPAPAPIEMPAGPVVTLPPMALAGLRYLPASTNVIIAVQPAALAAFNPQQPPRKVLTGAGVPELILATFENAGVPFEEVEQVVAGLTLQPDKLIPGVSVFAKFRKPVAEESFLKALQAERKPTAGRSVYMSKFNNLLVTPIDDRSWLFGLIDDDLAMADIPSKSLSHLSQPIRLAMSERIDPAAYAMAVTGEAKWDEANAFIAMSLKKTAAKLAKVRSLAVGISHSADGPNLKLSLVTIDSATASEVSGILRTTLGDNASVVVDGNIVIASVHDSLPKLANTLRGLIDSMK